MKTKLYYHEDGRLLYSRNWPEVPPVMVSANTDIVAYRNYIDQIKYLTSDVYAVVVTNHDYAMGCIVFHSDKPIERNQFYEIPNDVKINYTNDRYTVEIIKQ